MNLPSLSPERGRAASGPGNPGAGHLPCYNHANPGTGNAAHADLRPRRRDLGEFRPTSSTSTCRIPTSGSRRCSTAPASASPSDPVSDGDRRQHLDERRPQPVPPADRQAAGAARQDRPRDREPRRAAQAARHGEAKAGRHQVRFQRAQRLRPGDLPLGRHRPRARAGRGGFGRIRLGIPYVEFDVPVGTAKASRNSTSK